MSTPITPCPSVRGLGLRRPEQRRGELPPSLRAAHAPECVRPPQNATTRLAEHLRLADLFAGIGGFHLAFDLVGARCVFASENDSPARATYEANYRRTCPELFESGNFAGDITKVDADTIPDFDIVTAGFPCQPFSDAGKRHGFADHRGTMFFEIARIIAAKRPQAFFMENVKGLLSHHGGDTFRTIQHVLTHELGYSFHAQIIRACDFGLPQLRPRLFMVGFRDPLTPFRFPDPVPLTTSMDDIFGGNCERKIGRTLLASGHGKALRARYNFDAYLVDGALRRIGPKEAMAMQGFPPDFILPLSHQAAMRQLGNAVAIPAVAATARQILHSLTGTTTPEPSTTKEDQR